MKIFIPSRGRVNTQTTWDMIPDDLRELTSIVCPEDEVEAHLQKGRNVTPRPVNGIARVRQWIVENSPEDRILFLDDDLKFFVRERPNHFSLRKADRDDLIEIYYRLEEFLDQGYVHVGLTARQMNQIHFPAREKIALKMNAVYAIDRRYLMKHNLRYDQVELMEDYHITLSLLKLGYPNMVITDAAWDQTHKSGSPGGCAFYRTSAMQAQGARKLAELHPDVVDIVVKKPKTGWGESMTSSRVDVRVSWKKAWGIGEYRLKQQQAAVAC